METIGYLERYFHIAAREREMLSFLFMMSMIYVRGRNMRTTVDQQWVGQRWLLGIWKGSFSSERTSKLTSLCMCCEFLDHEY